MVKIRGTYTAREMRMLAHTHGHRGMVFMFWSSLALLDGGG